MGAGVSEEGKDGHKYDRGEEGEAGENSDPHDCRGEERRERWRGRARQRTLRAPCRFAGYVRMGPDITVERRAGSLRDSAWSGRREM